MQHLDLDGVTILFQLDIRSEKSLKDLSALWFFLMLLFLLVYIYFHWWFLITHPLEIQCQKLLDHLDSSHRKYGTRYMKQVFVSRMPWRIAMHLCRSQVRLIRRTAIKSRRSSEINLSQHVHGRLGPEKSVMAGCQWAQLPQPLNAWLTNIICIMWWLH